MRHPQNFPSFSLVSYTEAMLILKPQPSRMSELLQEGGRNYLTLKKWRGMAQFEATMLTVIDGPDSCPCTEKLMLIFLIAITGGRCVEMANLEVVRLCNYQLFLLCTSFLLCGCVTLKILIISLILASK